MSKDISEHPHIPQPRDLSYYVVLCFVVAPLWSIVPISWSTVLYHLVYRRSLPFDLFNRLLFTVAVSECIFSVYYTIRTIQISAPAPNPPNDVLVVNAALKRVLQAGMSAPTDREALPATIGVDRPPSPEAEIIRLEHDDHRAIDFRHCIRTWFGKVPWSHIRNKEVEAWLYWSIFNAAIPSEGDMLPGNRKVLRRALKSLEMRAGKTFEEGSNPAVKPLLLTLDPVNVCARPLVWYLGVRIASISLRSMYARCYGLRYGRFGELEYLIRIPEGYNRMTGPDPILFLHGLGLGVVQYHAVLAHLCDELPDVPLLVPLQPQLSQDVFHPRFLKPMGRHEKVDLLGRLLRDLGWAVTVDKERKGVTVLSHSNGSFSHAWMLKTHPELVSRSCFVDPVTFCLFEGDVCYNFIYSRCTNGLHLIARYFVGTELGVANLLQRHSDWLNNSLWFEEIPNARDARRSLYILGGKDSIVNASRVQRYLQSHGVTDGLWFDPNGHHGQALLLGGEGMAKVMDWLKDTPSLKVA